MSDTPPLQIGNYRIDLPCPRCGALVTVAARLTAVLTADTDDVQSLRLKARSRPADHACGQSQLPELFTATLSEPEP